MEERHRSLTRRWIAANSLAETVGMTAAAAAAVAVDRFALATVAALAVLVAGGLVEGTALGLAQSRVLASRWPALRVRRYLLVTVLVAGLGWAAGSVPGVLDEGGGDASPPLPLVLLGAAGIGLVLGPLLGAAQALVLRGAVRRPWRWVLASAAAWPPAMAVIYLGATAPSASWPWPAVVALGALTGAAAGAVLGAVAAPWLRALDGPSVAGRVVLRLLESPARGVLPGVVGLQVTGRRTGLSHRLPVQAALHGDAFVVVPGHPATKQWWRNLEGGAPVLLLDDGEWQERSATLRRPGQPGHAEAREAYRQRWPRVPVDGPLVVLEPADRECRDHPETLDSPRQLKRG